MLYSNQRSLQDRIVEKLLQEPSAAASLHEALNHSRRVSIQAVYEALRILFTAGVIVKHKHAYAVSSEWRNKVAQHINVVPEAPKLAEGESYRYEFHTAAQLDLYWKHLNAELAILFPSQPIFFYDPHEMWIYNKSRQISQRLFLQTLRGSGRSAYMLIGGETACDYVYKKQFSKYLSIHLDKKNAFKRNEHLTVSGDYVIRTKLPIAVAREIDMVYTTHENEETVAKKMEDIFSRKTKMTITVSKNAMLAKKLQKRITKDLYVPLSEREKYDLF